MNEKELAMLNRLVDAYLSFAEIQAKSEQAMTMKNWISKLDDYLALLGKGILKNAGRLRSQDAEERADQEYEVYKRNQDKNYLSDFDQKVKKLEQKTKKPPTHPDKE